jgi:hypothetical protein
MHINVVSLRSLNVVFTRNDFVIEKMEYMIKDGKSYVGLTYI